MTAGAMAALVGGELDGPSGIVIVGVNSLELAGPDELTFITSRRFARQWRSAKAGSALIKRGLIAEGHDPEKRALIAVPDPELAMIAALRVFAPPRSMPDVGMHPTAVVHPTAKVAGSARIGAHVTIGRESEVGENVVLHAGVRIYAQCRIGAGTELHANVVVRERCVIGRDVIIHPNVSIGADGFGYRPDPGGRGLIKVPHIGFVQIGDHVEIGANTCIDRGKFGATVIGTGTKIDNLVQIGHNCVIGRCVVIAGNVGLSGSVTVGDGVQIGGGAGVKDHVVIGAGARIAAFAGVMRDVPAGETHMGIPADEAMRTLRQFAAVRRMVDQADADASIRQSSESSGPSK